MFLRDVAHQLTDGKGWDLQSCSRMWLIVSVDTYEAHPQGVPVYLGRFEDNYCWFGDLEDSAYVFDHPADAKAELALADTSTTVPLFVVNLADLIRYTRSVPTARHLAIENVLSRSFFNYLTNRLAWVSNKKGNRG